MEIRLNGCFTERHSFTFTLWKWQRNLFRAFDSFFSLFLMFSFCRKTPHIDSVIYHIHIYLHRTRSTRLSLFVFCFFLGWHFSIPLFHFLLIFLNYCANHDNVKFIWSVNQLDSGCIQRKIHDELSFCHT